MPNVAKVLKEEIARVARKEAKSIAGPIQKTSAGARKSCADLKKRVAKLETLNRQLLEQIAKLVGAMPAAPVEEAAGRARITAKGIRSLRRKLGVSQAEFAALLNVSTQTVYLWEKATGAIRVQETTRAALLAIRGIGAREAKKRLADMAAAKKPVARGRKVRQGR